MTTLGYGFRPWVGDKAIVDGGSIRDYIAETAEAYGVVPHIRYGRKVTALSWDSSSARWTATVEVLATGGAERIRARWVHGCTGYYRYDEGYTPDLPGLADFAGTVVHPQHWPEDLDLADRRVVVIGSGATAMTLVPALAATDAAHVTMLQRSPTYVVSMPDTDPVGDALRRVLPDAIALPAIKWKNVAFGVSTYQLSRRTPALVRWLLRSLIQRQLPEDQVDAHFTPTYDPWDQRVCLVPNNDLFKALRGGRASVVTDHIDAVVPEGVRLAGGEHLQADVLVTATGLNLLMLGGMAIDVDGEAVDVRGRAAYRGMMLDGVPNLSVTLGYVNASWTLRADLVSQHVCRLLAAMSDRGWDVATPRLPEGEASARPIFDLAAGYVQRSRDEMPVQGTRAPWLMTQNYLKDLLLFRGRAVLDPDLELSHAIAAPTTMEASAVAQPA